MLLAVKATVTTTKEVHKIIEFPEYATEDIQEELDNLEANGATSEELQNLQDEMFKEYLIDLCEFHSEDDCMVKNLEYWEIEDEPTKL